MERTVPDSNDISRPYDLLTWQEMFSNIYDEHNRLYYSDAEVMLRLHEEIGESLESLRKERFNEIIDNLPDTFAWLMAFCNRMHIYLNMAAWHKYPNICPYGLERENCSCLTRDTKYRPQDHELAQFRRDRRDMPVSLRDWQKMFERLYGLFNKKAQTNAQVFYHLAEEVSELGKDLRLQNMDGMKAEAADVFAWLCGTATKLETDFDDLIWRHYPGECNRCHDSLCKCPKL